MRKLDLPAFAIFAKAKARGAPQRRTRALRNLADLLWKARSRRRAFLAGAKRTSTGARSDCVGKL
jgi:hypothetical protein